MRQIVRTSTPPLLDYRKPGVARKWGPFVWHLVNWYTLFTVIVTAMVLITPPVDGLIRQFNVELPALTRGVLQTGRWLNGSMGWVYLLPVPLLIAVVLGWPRAQGAPPRRSLRFYRLLSLFLLGTFAALFIFALVRPYVAMLDSIGNGK